MKVTGFALVKGDRVLDKDGSPAYLVRSVIRNRGTAEVELAPLPLGGDSRPLNIRYYATDAMKLDVEPAPRC